MCVREGTENGLKTQNMGARGSIVLLSLYRANEMYILTYTNIYTPSDDLSFTSCLLIPDFRMEWKIFPFNEHIAKIFENDRIC